MFYPPNYHRALKLQDALFADALKPETKPADKAQLARAWDILEARKRVIRGIGLPKSVDFTKVKAGNKARSSAIAHEERPVVVQDTTTGSVPPESPS